MVPSPSRFCCSAQVQPVAATAPVIQVQNVQVKGKQILIFVLNLDIVNLFMI